MSTYKKLSKHPLTNKWEKATWHDDFFGQHEYGVEFSDGSFWKPERVMIKHCETCNCGDAPKE